MSTLRHLHRLPRSSLLELIFYYQIFFCLAIPILSTIDNCQQYSSSGTSCAQCYPSYFYSSDTKSCVRCSDNCNTCTSAGACQKCSHGFYYNATTASCNACSVVGCLDCQEQPASCASCKPTLDLTYDPATALNSCKASPNSGTMIISIVAGLGALVLIIFIVICCYLYRSASPEDKKGCRWLCSLRLQRLSRRKVEDNECLSTKGSSERQIQVVEVLPAVVPATELQPAGEPQPAQPPSADQSPELRQEQ